jgi:hypothetical protein
MVFDIIVSNSSIMLYFGKRSNDLPNEALNKILDIDKFSIVDYTLKANKIRVEVCKARVGGRWRQAELRVVKT